MKTVRNITKSLTGTKVKNEVIQQLNIDGNTSYDSLVISDSFNNHFLSIAEKIHNTVAKSNNTALDYLHQAFKSPFPNIKYQYTSTKKPKKNPSNH
jgi:hypothetical protein